MELVASFSIFPKEKKNINNLLLSLKKDPISIQKTTGIKNTRFFKKDIKIKYLFNRLIKLAIQKKNIKPNNILVCSQTLDEAMPSISSQLVYLNNFESIDSCTDINAGCTGFVDLSRLAFTESQLNHNNYIFCLSGDLNSRIVNNNDYALSCVFGDLVNLSIFKASTSAEIIKDFFHYKVSLKHSNSIKRELNGFLQMDGMDVMTFVCDSVVPVLIEYLNKLKTKSALSEYSLVLHQANKFIVEFINKKIKKNFPEITTHAFCMEDIGNTGSSTIPFALQTYHSKKELKRKSIVCGYGVGMSVNIAILNMSEKFLVDKNSFIEI